VYLEKLIKKLKEAKTECMTKEARKNVKINIKICDMQIKIRDRWTKKKK
jgi:hypothetical protein